MVSVCTRELWLVGLSTNPIADTYGSITGIFCNGVTISNIATTGDYSQTNDCGAALNGNTCTIVVTFTPSTDGTCFVTAAGCTKIDAPMMMPTTRAVVCGRRRDRWSEGASGTARDYRIGGAVSA